MSDSEALSNSHSHKKWVEIQKSTFTNWCNMHLPEKYKIHDLYTEFGSDSVKLVKLYEAISRTTVVRYCSSPRIKPQILENLTTILNCITKDGVRLVNIGPTDIFENSPKLILALVWQMIQHYGMRSVSQSAQNLAGNGSCVVNRRNTYLSNFRHSGCSSLRADDKSFAHDNEVFNNVSENGRENGTLFDEKKFITLLNTIIRSKFNNNGGGERLTISNFTSSWNSGIALGQLCNALNEKCCKTVYFWEKNDKVLNCQNAISQAEKYFNVRPLLLPEHMASSGLDKKSMLTFLYLFLENNTIRNCLYANIINHLELGKFISANVAEQSDEELFHCIVRHYRPLQELQYLSFKDQIVRISELYQLESKLDRTELSGVCFLAELYYKIKTGPGIGEKNKVDCQTEENLLMGTSIDQFSVVSPPVLLKWLDEKENLLTAPSVLRFELYCPNYELWGRHNLISFYDIKAYCVDTDNNNNSKRSIHYIITEILDGMVRGQVTANYPGMYMVTVQSKLEQEESVDGCYRRDERLMSIQTSVVFDEKVVVTDKATNVNHNKVNKLRVVENCRLDSDFECWVIDGRNFYYHVVANEQSKKVVKFCFEGTMKKNGVSPVTFFEGLFAFEMVLKVKKMKILGKVVNVENNNNLVVSVSFDLDSSVHGGFYSIKVLEKNKQGNKQVFKVRENIFVLNLNSFVLDLKQKSWESENYGEVCNSSIFDNGHAFDASLVMQKNEHVNYINYLAIELILLEKTKNKTFKYSLSPDMKNNLKFKAKNLFLEDPGTYSTTVNVSLNKKTYKVDHSQMVNFVDLRKISAKCNNHIGEDTCEVVVKLEKNSFKQQKNDEDINVCLYDMDSKKVVKNGVFVSKKVDDTFFKYKFVLGEFSSIERKNKKILVKYLNKTVVLIKASEVKSTKNPHNQHNIKETGTVSVQYQEICLIEEIENTIELILENHNNLDISKFKVSISQCSIYTNNYNGNAIKAALTVEKIDNNILTIKCDTSKSLLPPNSNLFMCISYADKLIVKLPMKVISLTRDEIFECNMIHVEDDDYALELSFPAFMEQFNVRIIPSNRCIQLGSDDLYLSVSNLSISDNYANSPNNIIRKVYPIKRKNGSDNQIMLSIADKYVMQVKIKNETDRDEPPPSPISFIKNDPPKVKPFFCFSFENDTNKLTDMVRNNYVEFDLKIKNSENFHPQQIIDKLNGYAVFMSTSLLEQHNYKQPIEFYFTDSDEFVITGRFTLLNNDYNFFVTIVFDSTEINCSPIHQIAATMKKFAQVKKDPVKVYGPGLTGGSLLSYCGEIIVDYADLTNGAGDFEFNIVGARKTKMPPIKPAIVASNNASKTFRIRYKLLEPGNYVLSMFWNNKPIKINDSDQHVIGVY